MEREVKIVVVKVIDVDDGSTVQWEATVEYGNEKKKMYGKNKREVMEKIIANIPVSKKYIGGKPEFPPEYY